MKLKKIASLALAGIMAVSMLTACGEGGNGNNGEDVPPETVVTTGIADAANGERSDYAKSLGITYTETNALANALQAAAASAYKDSTLIEKAAGNGYAGVAAGEKKVVAKLEESLAGKFDASKFNNWGSLTTDDVYKMVKVYTVGGSFDAKDAAAMVSQELSKNEIVNSKMVLQNGQMVAHDSAEIAAVKITSNDDSTKSAWVVAVVFTQTLSTANS